MRFKSKKYSRIVKLLQVLAMITKCSSARIEVQTQQLEVAMEQLKIQSSKLSVMSNILITETDNKMVYVGKNTKKQELVVLRKNMITLKCSECEELSYVFQKMCKFDILFHSINFIHSIIQ